jgi:hypothetical protein
MWINLDHVPELLWDPNMCINSSKGFEVRDLALMALRRQLTEEETNLVKAKLDDDPKIIYKYNLSPRKFPDLVENNPSIAIEVLLKLMGMSSGHVPEFLSVLVNMNMSVQSIQVVNRLTSTVELPKEFVYMYITNCIQSCESIKDKNYQSRLVRLVCVFLQSLLKNKILHVDDLFIEVQAFCIEFSRIKEAANLFRLLKNMANKSNDAASLPNQ